GLIAAAVMAGIGLAWLDRRARAARAAGEGYGEAGREAGGIGDETRSQAQGEGYDLAEIARGASDRAPDRPGFWIALAPVLIVIAANYAFSVEIFPRLDTGYLAEDRYGATRIEAVRGIWAIIVALTLAILFLLATNLRRLAAPVASIGHGANAAILPIFNTASLVGFGAVVAGLPAFAMVQAGI
ncbi:MAG: GntP family permease, partial [Pseudomonadota bacterium]